MEKIYDYAIIGSGFGGSTSAMRLSEKGYDCVVIEKGKRYRTKDFPKTNWQVRKYLWAPLLKCFGFQKLTFFKEVFVLSGVGVGGGSLVYASTHMTPEEPFFRNKAWVQGKDWMATLMPFYDKANKMLGTTKAKRDNIEDHALQELAREMGREDTCKEVKVGVYYGDRDKAHDPFFNGLGPDRRGCIECAGCMVGCKHDAKNTLDKNYLYFAEYFGAEVRAETLVTKIEDKDGLYHLHTRKSTSWFKKDEQVIKAKGLVCSGGVLGTMDLLLKQKYQTKTLDKLSDKLGHNLRTNSESICGVVSRKHKLNNGVAISSVFNPDDHTHIEICKYPDGSDALGALAGPAAGPGNGFVRTAKMIGNIFRNPMDFLRTMKRWNLAPNTIFILVMQTLDNSMKMVYKGGLFPGMKIVNKGNEKVPAYIPIGQEVMHRYAEKVDGIPSNALTETMFNMSTTAHILGGVPMGETPEEGVVNDKFEVFNYPNFYILDGSIMPCNPGVNPSLTITALTEYAMDQIPTKDGYQGDDLNTLVEKAGAKQREAVSA